MSALPWMKWHPSDWRADPLVRACAPISRYVWMEMIGLMHEATPYGHLTLAGRKIDAETLSRLISVDLDTVKSALRELKAKGVFSVTEKGVIYSRRMIRDGNKREILKENGQKGGKKTQSKIKENQPLNEDLLEQKSEPSSSPRDQSAETRVKEDIPDRSVVPPVALTRADRPTDFVDVFDQVLGLKGCPRPSTGRRDAEISEKWLKLGVSPEMVRSWMTENIDRMLARAFVPKCLSLIDQDIINEHHRLSRLARPTNGDSEQTRSASVADIAASAVRIRNERRRAALGIVPGKDDAPVLSAVPS